MYEEDVKAAPGRVRVCVCVCVRACVSGLPGADLTGSQQTAGSCLTMAVGEQRQGGMKGAAGTGGCGVLFGECVRVSVCECVCGVLSFTPFLWWAAANGDGSLKGLTLR